MCKWPEMLLGLIGDPGFCQKTFSVWSMILRLYFRSVFAQFRASPIIYGFCSGSISDPYSFHGLDQKIPDKKISSMVMILFFYQFQTFLNVFRQRELAHIYFFGHFSFSIFVLPDNRIMWTMNGRDDLRTIIVR